VSNQKKIHLPGQVFPAQLLEENTKASGGQQAQHHDQPMVPGFTITFPVLWLVKTIMKNGA